MSLNDFRQLPARAGKSLGRRSLARIDLLLIPLALALFLGVWQLLVRWRNYPSFILPGPRVVWDRLSTLLADGTLVMHTGATLLEISGGLVLGLTAALVVGYGLAKSPLLERVLSPYIVASQAIPIVAIAPLLVIWFGFGWTSKVMVCALTVFFPAVVTTILGVRSVEPDLRALMRSLQASRWQTFTTLEVPAALPVLLAGLKVAVTLAVIGAVVGEFVGADRGLGFLINLARGTLDTPMLFVALFTLVVIALLLYIAVSALEYVVLAWKRAVSGEVMKKVIAVIVALSLLAGCGGTPTPLAPAEPTGTGAATAVAAAASPAAESPIATPGASATSSSPLATPAKPLTKVTLAMGYIPSVQFAPFYVAQEKGYFKDAGLDVEFRYGMESDLLKLVGTNELQFMIGSGEEVILGRSQGLPVRYVLRWYRKFPAVLFAKASSGIKEPKDLVGKKVGVPGLYGANYVGWEALVYATGLNPQQVSLQSIGFTQATAVSQGLVDAAMDYVVNGPVQLRLEGQDVVEIPVSNYVDIPSNGIITNDQTIKEKPEQVQAIVAAMTRGLRDTLADPDAAFQASMRAVPTAGGDQEKVSRAIFDESLKLWQAPEAELGLSDPAAWATAASFMKDMGLIQTMVAPADLFTNDFVAH